MSTGKALKNLSKVFLGKINFRINSLMRQLAITTTNIFLTFGKHLE